MLIQSSYVLGKLKKIIDETNILIESELAIPTDKFTTVKEAYDLIKILSSLNERYERILVEWLNNSNKSNIEIIMEEKDNK